MLVSIVISKQQWNRKKILTSLKITIKLPFALFLRARFLLRLHGTFVWVQAFPSNAWASRPRSASPSGASLIFAVAAELVRWSYKWHFTVKQLFYVAFTSLTNKREVNYPSNFFNIPKNVMIDMLCMVPVMYIKCQGMFFENKPSKDMYDNVINHIHLIEISNRRAW